MKPKIYIDGKDGTTGLQIYDRLSARSDIDLLLIDESKRKDPAERKKLLNAADLVFLCLPDVASFAKGIAGGLPMSGIMANEKCRNVLGPGTHATTFGANPVCAAAGLLVQETLTDDFLAEVQAKGDYLRKAIEALNLPCFGKTRGMGLMIGIEVRDGYDKGKILSRLIENGLLVLTAGPGMRLLPPLTITKAELDQGLEIMKKALENF